MSRIQRLAIETSSRIGSLAIQSGADVLERRIPTPREQTATVLSLVDALLVEAGVALADLDALVFGRGPGSFTGLRVAAAVVQGLSLASGVPIVGVSSLRALAHAGLAGRDVESALCCIDARMGEVYSSVYRREDGVVRPVADETIGPPDGIRPPAAAFIGLGDGFAAYADALATTIGQASAIDTAVVPGARQLLELAPAEIAAGRFLSPEAAVPVYLRDASAWRRA